MDCRFPSPRTASLCARACIDYCGFRLLKVAADAKHVWLSAAAACVKPPIVSQMLHQSSKKKLNEAIDPPQEKLKMGEYDDQRGSFAAALLLESIIRRIYSEKSSGEIQPLQWSILRYLNTFPENGCTMSKISSFLGVTHAPVVRAITTLINRGLVTQTVNPTDARSKLLALTPKGIAKMQADPILLVANFIQAQPKSEREQFQKFIRDMVLSTQFCGFGDDAKDPSDRR